MCACMIIHACVCLCKQTTEEDIGSPGAVATDICGMPGLLHECWDVNSTFHGCETNTHNHRASLQISFSNL